VPFRELVLELLATENPTVPLAVPELPEVIVTKLALLVAVQLPAQPLGEAVTVVLPVPPVAETVCVVAESVKAHEGVDGGVSSACEWA
jgi:hypothetical protein